MSDFPDELKYAATHEWVRVEEDGSVTIGISDHAQELLGDIVFIELPEEGATVSAKDEMSVVESVKAASDIYAPISGEVIAVNEDLTDAPETVNADPYGEGWICRILPSNPAELEELLDANTYAGMCE
ncbi:glycine cleavage system protein GcvH [Pseudohongiella sp. SYSU M77423]|uniref:glycine cleavage system protein GcvH n=1 Tax=unclassified Pseudohongiella TaxID=2629611 RepID=UPI000C3BE42E|nr:MULTISPECIES: glycine cleavage system protein GcvH [unclassified Pseudohongiella]MAO40247.1 glycine cleavage system protein H [Pseudohongiella sp.]MAY55431.1 glycine cleavage system protein H [Gammaproteobacteria bacterium]MEC8860499.1 glycine cleavage system protein GcvH [Pseudomonadota bacterium]MBJ55789.1 glycine cleavage system protein H [Gammaproteobacteria bacterium]MDH7942763.1 glycine cleavage system protein GcvH [Pseudohongiella sp. SYSU M77423]